MNCALLLVAALGTSPEGKLPITGLGAARIESPQCVYQYRVSTPSADCQRYCDQALGCYYSYIWMEAARNFETALYYDPNCAFAWLGLHKALEKWGKTAIPKPEPLLALIGPAFKEKLPSKYTKAPKDYALDMAKSLLKKASHREALLITAKLQEKGMWPDTKEDERKKKATATLDELLTLYEDDEEGWFARAQIAEGTNGGTPFYKALLRINPLHPGANHELVHFFETIKRPALGWQYAENYIKSSPGLPHAFHMQSHLATRIGKWQNTSDWSLKAVELEKAYHKSMSVSPGDDHQFQHHLETLTRSLVHDGRFAEAKAIKKDAQGYKYNFRPEWIRMALAEADYTEAAKLIDDLRKNDKNGAAYFAALMALAKNEPTRVQAELDVLRQSKPGRKDEKKSEARVWEIQGRLMCCTGEGEAGLKLLQKAVEKTKDDYAHHAWGNGGSLMESWGIGALNYSDLKDAEEAFQEALAHDSGSVRGALGLWLICDRTGRNDEAARYLKLAKKCWSRADDRDFDHLKSDMTKQLAE
ncbi:hypothetical protein BH11PLA2_BH11PLA2_11490 [soil metagenome]